MRYGGRWVAIQVALGIVAAASVAGGPATAAPVIGGGGVLPRYVEQAPASNVGADVTISGGGSYRGGSLEVSIDGASASETLSFPSVASADVADGVVSVVGSSVFLGNGTTADLIGTIDTMTAGQDGAPLRVDFVDSDLVNPGFESGDLRGWTALDERIDLGTTVIANCPTQDTATYPVVVFNGTPLAPRTQGDPPRTSYEDGRSPANDDYPPFVAGTKSTAVTSSAAFAGSSSSRLTLAGVETLSGYDVVRGPAIYSDEFEASAGDHLNFAWRADSGTGAHVIFAYLLDASTCSQTELVDVVAPTAGSTSGWNDVSFVVPARSNYQLVMVAGSWDPEGDRHVGSSVYLDDLSVTSDRIDDSVVQDLVRSIRYHNSSVVAPGRRSLAIRATNEAAESSEASLQIDVEPAPAAPMFTDGIFAGAPRAGVGFSDGVLATGYPTPTYSIVAGGLPPGLHLNATSGAITGTPQSSGPFSVTIAATSTSGSAHVTISGGVTGAPTAFTDGSIESLTSGLEAAEGIGADGYPAPTYSVSGSFPPGLRLDTVTGRISGTPTTPGNYAFTISATNASGTVSKSFSLVVAPTDRGFLGLSPSRALDTRDVGVKPAGGSVQQIAVAGHFGVPVDATAVVLNVAVTEPDDAGFVTIFPCGATVPWVANLNYVAGQTVSNSVRATIGAGGTICVSASSTTHLVVDVDGAYSPSAGSGRMIGLTPTRLLDSRETSKLTAHSTLRIPISGRVGIPEGTTSVVLNVAATEPEDAGYFTVHPCDVPPPVAANVNYVAGQTVSNSATAVVGVDGGVCVTTSATAHLVVDVNAAYVNGRGSSHVALTPGRLVDTRTIGGAVEALSVRAVVVADGTGSAPRESAAVALNIAVTEPQAAGFLVAFPCGEPIPTAANVNFDAGSTVSGSVVSRVGAGGAVCLFTTATTHVVVDVNGAYSAAIV